jgi:hypothetical protein
VNFKLLFFDKLKLLSSLFPEIYSLVGLLNKLLTLLNMKNFPRNRYNPDELLSVFERAEMNSVHGEFFKSIEAKGVELEIYFPNKAGQVETTHISRARSVLTQVQELDNLVQDSCENEYQKSNFHIGNFLLYLAIIEIKESQVSFRYYGERVNTEWLAIFKEDENGIWKKVNF